MEYAVIFLPLLGTIIGYLSKYFGDIASQLLTTLTVCIAAILTLAIFYNGLVHDNYGNYIIFEWIKSGDFQINWSINIDPLSSIMLVVVTLVSALVHIYSIGYMSHDPFKPRFMSYLSLFTFAMLVLVVSDNFIQLFFGWEGVGLSSYLLIGFWYKKDSANKAAIKAFLVNRIGDFGLAIGVFLIFFVAIMFFYPDGGGYVIEYVNYEAADNLKTPEHIVPSWYYTPYYAMLRAVTFPLFGLTAKFLGFVVMAAGIAIFVALPWLDRSPVKSIKYKGIYSKFFLALFVVSFLVLGYLGAVPSTPARTIAAQIFTVCYFAYFLLMPIYSKYETCKPVPERVQLG